MAQGCTFYDWLTLATLGFVVFAWVKYVFRALRVFDVPHIVHPWTGCSCSRLDEWVTEYCNRPKKVPMQSILYEDRPAHPGEMPCSDCERLFDAVCCCCARPCHEVPTTFMDSHMAFTTATTVLAEAKTNIAQRSEQPVVGPFRGPQMSKYESIKRAKAEQKPSLMFVETRCVDNDSVDSERNNGLASALYLTTETLKDVQYNSLQECLLNMRSKKPTT